MNTKHFNGQNVSQARGGTKMSYIILQYEQWYQYLKVGVTGPGSTLVMSVLGTKALVLP